MLSGSNIIGLIVLTLFFRQNQRASFAGQAHRRGAKSAQRYAEKGVPRPSAQSLRLGGEKVSPNLTSGSALTKHLIQFLTLIAIALALSVIALAQPSFKFVNIAREAGITAKTIYGGEKKNLFQLENLGSGIAWFDYDHDGWLDLFQVNGTRLEPIPGEQPTNHLYRNDRNGKYTDISTELSGAILEPHASRGCAFGDFDNDGDPDIAINAIHSYPELLRCDSTTNNNWLKVRLIGTKSNRSGIGARLKCEVEGHHVQMEEVRSGGSYYSQNDLRVHFGLGKANVVKKLEIQWPSGAVEVFKDLSVNQILTIKEGEGIAKK